MKERIRELRKKKKLTQVEFGKRIGLTRDAVASIEYGNANATEVVILLICREFSVDYGWLKEGVGEMYSSEEDELQSAIDVLMTGENETAKAILRALAKLSEPQWKVVDQMLSILEEERDG